MAVDTEDKIVFFFALLENEKFYVNTISGTTETTSNKQG
jgi:hypothetical protein